MFFTTEPIQIQQCAILGIKPEVNIISYIILYTTCGGHRVFNEYVCVYTVKYIYNLEYNILYTIYPHYILEVYFESRCTADITQPQFYKKQKKRLIVTVAVKSWLWS